MSEGSVGGKGEDGDEYWSGGPEVDTQSIQILSPLQACQLKGPEERKKAMKTGGIDNYEGSVVL